MDNRFFWWFKIQHKLTGKLWMDTFPGAKIHA